MVRLAIRPLLLVPLLATLLPGSALAQTDCDLGLVLSGGGARGIAHIGVLEVLAENGIRPDCVAGASVGAIVGALYAAGHPPEEILEILETITWRDLYLDPGGKADQPLLHRLERQRTAIRLGIEGSRVRTPPALLDDTLVNRILIRHLAPAGFLVGRDFDRLPIAFRATGTDLLSGNRVVLHEGDLALAVRGSMSVPLAYPPVPVGNALLVDGGLVDNLPVGVARDMGADFVVAVDVSTPLEREVVPDLLGVTKRIIDLLFAAKNTQYASPPDMVVEPEIGDHSFADYSNFDFLVEQGRMAAREALERIPARYRERPRIGSPHAHGQAFADRLVTAVEVEGNEYLADSVLRQEFGVEEGDEFDFDEALERMDHMVSSGLLTGAWIDILPDGPDGMRIVLRVREEYRHTVDIGLAYKTDHQAQGLLRFETRNLLGTGDRLQLQGYASAQDLIVGAHLHGEQLFGAHLGYQLGVERHRERPKVFHAGDFINRAEFERRHVQALTNLPLSADSLLQLGFRFGQVEVVDRLGLETLPGDTFQHRVLVAHYIRDELESPVLPRSGSRVSVLGEQNLEGLGASVSYTRIRAAARLIVPMRGRLVGDVNALYGYSRGDLPVYDWFRLGGPDLVPGLAREEIWGAQALAASAALAYDPTSIVRVYVRAGAGNVWERVGDVDPSDVIFGAGLGMTIATPLGPLRADYGWAQEGRNRLYFSIGWQ